MKYNIGDKFIIEIEGVKRDSVDGYSIKLKEGPVISWTLDNEILDQLQQTDCSGEAAWETAKKILFEKEFTHDVLNEIFGTMNLYAIMRDYAPHEAKAKIDEWKKQKEEVKVGDVVENKITGFRAVVTKVYGRELALLYDDGSFSKMDKYEFVKTNGHLPFKELLEEIKGE